MLYCMGIFLGLLLGVCCIVETLVGRGWLWLLVVVEQPSHVVYLYFYTILRDIVFLSFCLFT